MKLMVMCGGYGTKLWPLSRKTSPKQFVLKINGKSPFRHNIELLLSKYKPEDILLATSIDQEPFLKEQAPEIPEENYFLEPCYRSHGAATAMMVSKLIHLSPDETVTTVQADALKVPGEKYLQTLEAIDSIVQTHKCPVTSGIVKENPVMGCDYFILGDRVEDHPQVDAYRLIEFLGRTDYEKTKEAIKNSKACLHTNYWSWTPRLFIDAFHKYTPDWGKAIDEMSEEFSKKDYDIELIRKIFEGMRKGPIEDLMMQILKEVVVIDINHDWLDFGTWGSVADYAKNYENGRNHERLIEVDSKNNYVRAGKDKAVALIGVDNLAVIDTEDGLLITPIDKAGRVGEVVEKIESNNWEEYL